MIVDGNGDPVEDDALLDLDAMNDVALDPLREASRMANSHVDAAKRAADPFTGYSTMAATPGSLTEMFGSVTTAPEISKRLLPDFPLLGSTEVARRFFEDLPSGVTSGTSAIGEWASSLGSTITATMPALSMLDVMAEAGVDGRRLGFDSFSVAVPGPELDALVKGAAVSQWNDATTRGYSTDALDAALGGVLTANPMIAELREFDDRTAAIEELLRGPALDRYSWSAPDVYSPAVERELAEPAGPVADPVADALVELVGVAREQMAQLDRVAGFLSKLGAHADHEAAERVEAARVARNRHRAIVALTVLVPVGCTVVTLAL